MVTFIHMDSSIPFPPSRRGRVSRTVLGASALVLLAATGVYFAVRTNSSKPKDLPKGRVLAVQPLASFEPNLTEADKEIIKTGPDRSDKESVKRYLLALAKLEPNPKVRQFYEQRAVYLTDGYGVTPAITAKNPQVDSVIAALRDGNHPERLNPLVAPSTFNAKSYKSDPTAYLNVAEPGRVFQRLPDSATNAPFIQPMTPFSQDVKQGDKVAVSVKAAPGYPVTFTSFDDGSFENGLTTITVEADSAGVATVHFLGMPGTVLVSNLLASSPMARGQLKFQMNTLVYADGHQVVTK